jgi:hypothetical protein
MTQGGTQERLIEHLSEMSGIAFAHEPDWDKAYEGADHSWCWDASLEVAAYLTAQGISARTQTGGLCGNHHTWVVLDDGTIVDPTVEQYIGRGEKAEVDHTLVPWLRSPDGDVVVAVVPPGHPFHSEYEWA